MQGTLAAFRIGASAILFAAVAAHGSILYSPEHERLVNEETGRSPLEVLFPLNRSALEGKGVPNPAPTSARFPNHTVFATLAEAVAWEGRVAPRLKRAFGGTKFELIDPASDSRYPVLQSYLHDTWNAYKTLFPATVGTLPEPPILIIDTDIVNAFVVPDPESGKIAHAVLVFSGLINALGGTTDRRAYSGILAHELAHAVFRHLLPKYQGFFSRFYHPMIVAAAPAAEGPRQLGYEASNDAVLNTQVYAWLRDAAYAGESSSPGLADLPIPTAQAAHSLIQLLAMLAAGELADSSPACQAAAPALGAWLEGWQKFPGAEFQADTITAAILPKQGARPLADSAHRLALGLQACASQPTALAKRKSLASYLGAPTTSLATAVAQAYDGSPDSARGLQAAVSMLRQDMSRLETQIRFPTLGWLTFEEHADDCSALINYQISQDALALDSGLDALVRGAHGDLNALKSCEDSIAAGHVPPIGFLEDPHHGICYRKSNLTRLSAAIQADPSRFGALAKDFEVRSTPPGGWSK